MKRTLAVALFSFAIVLDSTAAKLPGFSVEQVAVTSGFCSAFAMDSHGVLYYSTTTGDIFRVDAFGGSTKIAHVGTQFIGNSGLLGMVLLDDNTAVVHYTTPGPTYEIISHIDLTTGAEGVIAQIPDDVEMPGRTVPSEHHGGGPKIGDNGSIYVGIGDFGAFLIAAKPQWNAGKILRIDPDGTVTQVASGFRNPFGLAWDAPNKRLIVADNGDLVNDEINIVTSSGGFYGWPYTMGNEAAYAGAIPPIYVFPKIVAPTGLARLSGNNSYMSRGYILGAYVTKAVYYIPDVDARPMPDPLPLVNGETPPVIDVAEGNRGEIFFATATTIYQLKLPQRGDCNGDGLVNYADLDALNRELADGDPHPAIAAQDGSYAGSWGCDVNGDGVISSADREALLRIISARARAVRMGR